MKSFASTETEAERVPSIEEWRAERNKALETLDMDYARRTMPHASDDAVRLLAMHKARYECRDISDELRRESERYLKAANSTRIHGLPWPKRNLPR